MEKKIERMHVKTFAEQLIAMLDTEPPDYDAMRRFSESVCADPHGLALALARCWLTPAELADLPTA